MSQRSFLGFALLILLVSREITRSHEWYLNGVFSRHVLCTDEARRIAVNIAKLVGKAPVWSDHFFATWSANRSQARAISNREIFPAVSGHV